MLPLEWVGPGGGLSMLLSPCLNGEMPAESSRAGGDSDGNIQLRPDDRGFCTALDFKFCVFSCFSFLLFSLIRINRS
jgi:hypothetical protein